VRAPGSPPHDRLGVRPRGSGKTTVADRPRPAARNRPPGDRGALSIAPLFRLVRSSLKPPSPPTRRTPAAPGEVQIRWQGYRRKRLDSRRALIYLARIVAFRSTFLRWRREEDSSSSSLLLRSVLALPAAGSCRADYVRILRAMMPGTRRGDSRGGKRAELAIRRPTTRRSTSPPMDGVRMRRCARVSGTAGAAIRPGRRAGRARKDLSEPSRNGGARRPPTFELWRRAGAGHPPGYRSRCARTSSTAAAMAAGELSTCAAPSGKASRSSCQFRHNHRRALVDGLVGPTQHRVITRSVSVSTASAVETRLP
jgi:hypothetical protein